MEYKITVVQPPPSIKDMLPEYQYQFVDQSVSSESAGMYQSLVEFLTENEEFVLQNSNPQYALGFKQAIALTRLWLDSLYIGDDTKNEQNSTSTNQIH